MVRPPCPKSRSSTTSCSTTSPTSSPRVRVLRRPVLRPPQRLRHRARHRVRAVADRHRRRGAGVHDRRVRRPGVRSRSSPGVVDCGGTSVRGNIINVDARPRARQLGMKVRLATYSLGTDDNGTEAIGFGFEPVD